MVAIIGLIMFAVSSYLALSKKMHLMVPFVVVPVVAGLCCGFSLTDVLNFAGTGVQGVFNSVLLCVFAGAGMSASLPSSDIWTALIIRRT